MTYWEQFRRSLKLQRCPILDPDEIEAIQAKARVDRLFSAPHLKKQQVSGTNTFTILCSLDDFPRVLHTPSRSKVEADK